MIAAFQEVYGAAKPYSITGSLPCIRELQEAGFDVQAIGFVKLSTYHSVSEYCLLSDFRKGLRTLAALIKHNGC
jgi:acetylornithine deacetylase